MTIPCNLLHAQSGKQILREVRKSSNSFRILSDIAHEFAGL